MLFPGGGTGFQNGTERESLMVVIWREIRNSEITRKDVVLLLTMRDVEFSRRTVSILTQIEVWQ